MLLIQRSCLFARTIVYTAFYAKVYKFSYNKIFQDFAENVKEVLSE